MEDNNSKNNFAGKSLFIMLYFRNFIYVIDKRSWKYYFLMLTLCKSY